MIYFLKLYQQLVLNWNCITDFWFGIYELFVSEIDFAILSSQSLLKIRDLDQLKNKIIKVIIIVLIVKFFEKVLKFSKNYSSL